MWQVYKILNLFYLLLSSSAWFSYVLPGRYIPLLVSILIIVLFAFGNFKVKITPRGLLLAVAIILYGVYTSLVSKVNDGIFLIFTYFPIIFVFILNKDQQKSLLRFVSKWVCIVFAVSIGWFFLSKIVALPHTTFVMPEDDFYQAFDNYFLFISSAGYESDAAGVLRFSSIFLEPGHFSMVSTLLLFANRYELKKYPLLWVPLFGILISYSLTGYVILLLSFILLKIRNTLKIHFVTL